MARSKGAPIKKDGQVNMAINTLARRQLAWVWQAQFNMDDIIRLFIPKEERDFLRKPFKECAPKGVNYALVVNVAVPEEQEPKGDFQIRFAWDNRTTGGFFVPKRYSGGSETPVVTLSDDAPEDLIHRFREMAGDLNDISYKFGALKWVFDELNKLEVCRSPAQMRYIFPGIVPLLRQADLDIEADEIAEASMSAMPRSVPPRVMDLLPAVNRVVAKAMLVEKAPPVTHQVHYQYSQTNYHGLFEGFV